jgi:hypothetical protein
LAKLFLLRREQRQVLPAAKHHHGKLRLLRVGERREARHQAGEQDRHAACHHFVNSGNAR